MTTPLFIERDTCGCETALGHVCCPPFASAENWPRRAELQTRKHLENGKMESQNKAVPGSDAVTPDVTEDLTPVRRGFEGF